MVHVSFRHPEETDLVFFYLDEQMRTFDEEGMRRPDHQILIGEKEIIVEKEVIPNTHINLAALDGFSVRKTDGGTVEIVATEKAEPQANPNINGALAQPNNKRGSTGLNPKD